MTDTNQLGQTRTYAYDAANRLTSVKLPLVLDPATNTMTQPAYTYGYDAFGNQALIQDPLGHQTTFTYNNL